MRFADVIGHEDLKRMLAKGVDEGRVSHAQLFSGRPGSGPLPLALAYAQYVKAPAANLFRIPDNVSYEEAGIIESSPNSRTSSTTFGLSRSYSGTRPSESWSASDLISSYSRLASASPERACL